MSDRAATEVKFNELLEAYREEILPEMIKDWKDLSEELQSNLTRLNNFFCGLHGLVHIAEVSNNSLKEMEALHFKGAESVPIKDARYRIASESAVCRMIRTTCIVFAYGEAIWKDDKAKVPIQILKEPDVSLMIAKKAIKRKDVWEIISIVCMIWGFLHAQLIKLNTKYKTINNSCKLLVDKVDPSRAGYKILQKFPFPTSCMNSWHVDQP